MIKKLIDVSYAQGAIDWKKVKQQYGGAMIRATAGYPHTGGKRIYTGIDTCFRKNVEGALAAGMKVGAYHFSYALTAEEARMEALHFLKTIQPYRLEYPAVLDFEWEKQGELTNRQMADICVAFLEAVEQGGYYAMLYSPASWLEYRLVDRRLKKYDKWVAHVGVGKPMFTGAYGMWQYHWMGRVNGIAGDVDLNNCYKDYPAIIRTHGLNHFNNIRIKTNQGV